MEVREKTLCFKLQDKVLCVHIELYFTKKHLMPQKGMQNIRKMQNIYVQVKLKIKVALRLL